MLNFTDGLGMFAVAGAAAATVPAIIHLLNRQRFRVVEWAPMQFLHQAMLRSRKMLEMRDVILMLLRTSALLLFGLALSRPFFSEGYGLMSAIGLLGGFFGIMFLVGAAVIQRTSPRLIALAIGLVLVLAAAAAFGSDFLARRRQAAAGQTTRQPVHVVLLIDNSLSMAYLQPDGGTLLEAAKKRADTFLDDLPGGSRVTVIPMCGGPGGILLDPRPSMEEAREAIKAVQVVDASANTQEAARLAIEASQRLGDLDKRVILLSDQQRISWPQEAGEHWKQIPDLQIVDMAPEAARENTFVRSLTLQDGIADKDVPATLTAVVRYDGPKQAHTVGVTLKVRDQVIETRPVELQPGQSMPVTFEHRFAGTTARPGRPEFVPVSVSITPADALPTDDSRFLIVPVVAALPVLFVDQYGQQEDPELGIYGETAQLRRLLAPQLSRREDTPQIIEVRHMTIDRLAAGGRKALADVRLVVVAGVADPVDTVTALREYVQQGGQLLIATGGDFQPAAWNLSAWKDGAGLLPAPLEDKPFGKTVRETSGQAGYFQLQFESLLGDYFDLPGMDEQPRKDLWSLAYFFKAAVVVEGASDALVTAETERIKEQIQFLIESDRKRKSWGKDTSLSTEEQAALEADKKRRAQVHPHWLLWTPQRIDDPLDRRPNEDQTLDQLAKELAEATRPRVLARFTPQVPGKPGFPYLMTRSIGRGNILFLTSGTYGNWATGWNTLGLRDAVVLYDRILRSMLEKTLPLRNEIVGTDLVLPIAAADRRDSFVLARSGDANEESLTPEVLEGDTYGLVIRNVFRRGTFVARRESRDGQEVSRAQFVQQIAYNGPAVESEIGLLDKKQLTERMGETPFKWIGKEDQISLQGARVHGESLWKWLIWSVLALLLAERVVVGWPRLTGSGGKEVVA